MVSYTWIFYVKEFLPLDNNYFLYIYDSRETAENKPSEVAAEWTRRTLRCRIHFAVRNWNSRPRTRVCSFIYEFILKLQIGQSVTF